MNSLLKENMMVSTLGESPSIHSRYNMYILYAQVTEWLQLGTVLLLLYKLIILTSSARSLFPILFLFFRSAAVQTHNALFLRSTIVTHIYYILPIITIYNYIFDLGL